MQPKPYSKLHSKLQLQLHLKLRCFTVIIIPTLLLGSTQYPVQGQEPLQVAQLFDSASPQSSAVQTSIRNFFTLLAQQDFEQAQHYMSPSLITASNSTAQLQQAWQALLRSTGNLIEIRQIYPSEVLGFYTVLVTIRFENSTEDFVLDLDQNQQITAVNFLRLGSIQVSAETFVDAISRGDYALARSYLSADLKRQFLPDAIGQRWEAILTRFGPFRRRTTSTVVRGANYDAVLINLEFEQNSGEFLIFFNPLGQIIGLQSPPTSQ
ncbi:MAG TPA: DUF3887 domain-containing protein [Chroococcidiopsis sp.]